MYQELKQSIDNLIKALRIISMPFTSQYRLLQFSGLADGTLLNPDFSMADIIGRTIVIKSIKFVPFSNLDQQDIALTDGATTTTEIIPDGFSFDRLFERYRNSVVSVFRINNSLLPIFQPVIAGVIAQGNSYLRLDLDNIFYQYPAKVDSMSFSVFAQILQSIAPEVVSNPAIKVYVECYLF